MKLVQVISRERQIDQEIHERQALKEAYRIVREDLEKHNLQDPDKTEPQQKVVAHANGKGPTVGKATLVRTAVESMLNPFSVSDIGKLIPEDSGIDKGDISSILWRMCDKQEITLHQKGKGRRAHLYKKI